MSNVLYIIGNGFDLHHGIPSSYKEFGEYLRKVDNDTFSFVERYFDADDKFWFEFEERLAFFDSDTLIDDASNFLVGYGAEEWSDAYHHDYQYEIDRAVKAISATMRARFAEWIRQLPLPHAHNIAERLLPIDTSATFLNFNYTPSLQQLYAVPDDRILHIHGAGRNSDASLILGHGWEPEENPDPYRFWDNPEDADMRIVEGQELIDSYFKETFKPTEQILRNNQHFFDDLGSVKKIFVMGHSLSEVDHAYFTKVIQHIDIERVNWKISHHRENALPALQERVVGLGLASKNVRYGQLAQPHFWH
ncbi:MAG: bacteriophage abortive infection AbiH family protein [Parasphingorhabdus sp.]